MKHNMLVAGGILAVLAIAMVGTALLYVSGQERVEPPAAVAATSPVASTSAPLSARATPALPSSMATPIPTIVAAETRPPSPSPATAWQTEPGTLERKVEEAYLRYWEARADALRRTDTSHLAAVMADGELERTIEQIERLRAEGRAARVDIVHQYVVLDVTPDSASIQDEMLNRSVLIDPRTGKDLQDPGAGVKLVTAYTLHKIDGTWKVVNSVDVMER